MINRLQSFSWTVPFLGFFLGYFIPHYFLSFNTDKTPHVVGKSIQEAMSILTQQSLNATLIKEHEDAVMPAGTVLHQTPSPYQPIKSDQTVSLIVSKKPPFRTTPSLINNNAQNLTSLVKKNNAYIELATIPSKNKSKHCIAQSPQADFPLVDKTIIAYLPQEPSSLCIVPSFINIPLKRAQHELSSMKIGMQIFHHGALVPSSFYQENLTVVAQRPLPGSIIDLKKPPIIQLEVK